MTHVAKLYLLVPVLNESPNIPRLFKDLKSLDQELRPQFHCSFVFIDDGSTDDTCLRISMERDGLDVEVLRHGTNRGPGAAFATAFAYLEPRLQPQDWVVTLEGDNTSRLAILCQMLTRRLEGFDVVLATPYAYGGGITQTSLLRIFLSHVANTLVKELLGIRGILTMSSFFRLYSAPILRRLQERYGAGIIERPGFECMVELLAKLIRVEATISEVAMPLDGSQRAGRSKMKILRTAKGYLSLFWRSRLWN